MATITVKVENQKVKQGLRVVGDAIPRATDRLVKKTMEAARDEVRTYPPELPGQKYKRTGRRYRATKVVRADTRAYRLESNPVYPGGRTANPFVVGDAKGLGQAWMHVGRWTKIKDAVDKHVKALLKDISQEIGAILRRSGMGM
jgi:hypothetical protein